MSTNRLAFAALAAVVLVVLFIWPTPYHYEKISYQVTHTGLSASTHDQVWRVNRLTGSTDLILDSRPLHPIQKEGDPETYNMAKR